MERAQSEALTREGIEALRRGDARSARNCFDSLAEAGPGVAPPWMMLAQACRQLGDTAGEERALTRILEGDRRNLPALLAMGEVKARAGDDRAANTFYKSALNAASMLATVPPGLGPALQRAQNFLASAQQRFEQFLRDRLSSEGLDGAGGRIGHSLDLLLGKAELYQQQPTSFYFPGLPQRYFYERDEFPWLEAVEAAIPAMQEELAGVLATTREFDPYIERSTARPSSSSPLLGDPSWGAFYFWRGGALVEDNAARCPRTVKALASAPMPVIPGRSPMALYSVLKPGTHIQPHHGLLNTRLICHVPLATPGDCALRVGSETREWRPGEALIFDDSVEHEAWNRSGSTRVILLFEIWRPEIADEERAALTAIFEAIGDYKGAPAEEI